MVVLTKRKITGFKDYVENVDKMTEEVRCLYPFLVVLCVPSHPGILFYSNGVVSFHFFAGIRRIFAE